MSEYERIIETTGNRRGRKPLPVEERDRRRALQKEQNRKRQEARRRAFLVLQHRHSAEFEALLAEELSALSDATASESVVSDFVVADDTF